VRFHMQTINPTTMPPGDGMEKRIKTLFQESQDNIHCRTDRLFAGLMIFQWLAAMAAAFWISPRTWIGTTSQIHWHVWAAIFLGGVITSLPVYLAWKQPGRALTRHTIAAAQMIFSALLIDLTGGRIETHFHIFGSLAFLAFYRDWRVLITATVVVVVDHFARGVYWPQSLFGILAPSPWRWLEHSGWVIFEDVFLLISIRQSLGEMLEVASRRAKLETVNTEIENQVTERTAALTVAQKELLEASRRAGMAEVATGILHNVGNVLNSVNVASSCVANSLKKSKAANLSKVVTMLREHESDLGSFLTTDAKGKQLPAYLGQLAEHLAGEQADALKELSQLQKNIEHIKDIVTMQQGLAKASGLKEKLQVNDLVEDALRMNASTLTRHDIEVIKEFKDMPLVTVEKHKVLQILVNLVRNAKQACSASGLEDKRMTIRTTNQNGGARISVCDNGVGIPPENLTRIFAYGFTTKEDGHGFGLHSGALAAKEMGGSLTVHSDGHNQGATFTLDLPNPTTEDSNG
jgi:signal transduction histidine kinase